jgi:hypothetical protein
MEIFRNLSGLIRGGGGTKLSYRIK